MSKLFACKKNWGDAVQEKHFQFGVEGREVKNVRF